LWIQTDWIESTTVGQSPSIQLEGVDDPVFRATITNAPTGAHLIRFVDITLCRPNDPREPFVTSGVSVNNIDLTRVLELSVPGAAQPSPALAFTILGDGTVQP
jgi:hypothetical protein